MNNVLAGRLVLADGTVIEGAGAGTPRIAIGELVFQTGMTGYQEALTDPSYAGQLLVFTYPLVGSYGVGPAANQSGRIQPHGVVLRELMPNAGHRDSRGDLATWLAQQRVPALTGVDTRFLTRKVREYGVIPGALAVAPADRLPSVAELLACTGTLEYDATDFVAGCSTPDLIWHAPARPDAPRVAVLDYGVKASTVDHLRARGGGVWVVPAHWDAARVLALQPDSVLLSNGPGDPARLDYAVATVRDLLAQPQLPVFGICLGHQLIARAVGAGTRKMRFGHRGVNQPVQHLDSGRLMLTTQNHGYMVDPSSLPAGCRVTHTNLNDGTVEGLAQAGRPVWGVQWHPEAAPGPADTRGLLDEFLALTEGDHA